MSEEKKNIENEAIELNDDALEEVSGGKFKPVSGGNGEIKGKKEVKNSSAKVVSNRLFC